MDTTNWKWFRYDEIFDITGSKTTPIEDLEAYGNGDFPYVTTQAVNNGVEGFYNYCTEKGGVLTLSGQQKASDSIVSITPKLQHRSHGVSCITD